MASVLDDSPRKILKSVQKSVATGPLLQEQQQPQTESSSVSKLGKTTSPLFRHNDSLLNLNERRKSSPSLKRSDSNLKSSKVKRAGGGSIRRGLEWFLYSLNIFLSLMILMTIIMIILLLIDHDRDILRTISDHCSFTMDRLWKSYEPIHQSHFIPLWRDVAYIYHTNVEPLAAQAEPMILSALDDLRAWSTQTWQYFHSSLDELRNKYFK